MLVACRLAGLSALGAEYAGVRARAQCGPRDSRTHGNHRSLLAPLDTRLRRKTCFPPRTTE